MTWQQPIAAKIPPEKIPGKKSGGSIEGPSGARSQARRGGEPSSRPDARKRHFPCIDRRGAEARPPARCPARRIAARDVSSLSRRPASPFRLFALPGSRLCSFGLWDFAPMAVRSQGCPCGCVCCGVSVRCGLVVASGAWRRAVPLSSRWDVLSCRGGVLWGAWVTGGGAFGLPGGARRVQTQVLQNGRLLPQVRPCGQPVV